jgi:hypothetical protein
MKPAGLVFDFDSYLSIDADIIYDKALETAVAKFNLTRRTL